MGFRHAFAYRVDFMRDVFFLDLNVFYEYFVGVPEKHDVKNNFKGIFRWPNKFL